MLRKINSIAPMIVACGCALESPGTIQSDISLALERIEPLSDMMSLEDAETLGLSEYLGIFKESAELQASAYSPEALASLIEAISADAGITQDASQRVALADIPEELGIHVTSALTAIRDCSSITNRILATRVELPTAPSTELIACSTRLFEASTSLRNYFLLNANGAYTAILDIWPVVRLDGFTSASHIYNDYLLIVDAGGDDTYINNGGSNVIDVNYSPTSSPVPGRRGGGRSRGCQQAITGLTGLVPSESAARDPDCIFAASLLVDVSGNDIYGHKTAPSFPDVDVQCTTQQLVTRMLTNGAGFAGVGILRDSSGNDRYFGKTVSNGSGHLGGIGILVDESGWDLYDSIRNSQGMGLFGGVGMLLDASGSDQYTHYMPAGGIIDDEDTSAGGPFCDSIRRFLQGAGSYAGIGILFDRSGDDSYYGAYNSTFQSPAPIAGRAGSQGFGNNGGFGVLADYEGYDRYEILGNQGSPIRENGPAQLDISEGYITSGGIIAPDPTCRNSTCNGLFIDALVSVRP